MEKIIEIQAVEFNARTLTVGVPVKVLIKNKVYPGMIREFVCSEDTPSINIMYLKSDYSHPEFCFAAYNESSEDIEIAPISEEFAIWFLDEKIREAEVTLHELKRKKDVFLEDMGKMCFEKEY